MKAGFEFVEGATSDLSFVAHAATLDGLFAAASEALVAATVEDPSSVAPSEHRTSPWQSPTSSSFCCGS